MKKLLFLSLILLASCKTFFNQSDERILARVEDDYLYESDLKGIVPPGASAKDSLQLVRGFIDNWIRQQLLIQQAEKNLSSEQLDFTKQLENYRNALVIFEYEKELVRQKLDTLVSDEEIQAYYDANQPTFLLKSNIVQIQYVKLPLGSSAIPKVKRLLSSSEPDDKNTLAEICEKQASDYFLDDQNWMLFSDLLTQVPVKTYNQEEFLKNNKSIDYQDSTSVYLVYFKDFRIKESLSPLSFEKQRIKEILINKRKIDMINKMREDLYTRALKKNDFETY